MRKKTEMRNPNTMHIDKMSTLEMLTAIQEENLNAVKAVGDAIDSIAEAVDVIDTAMKADGRLIYIGAGTSGRLGVIDAAECPPTFGVSYDKVIGIMAGGENAMFRASENKEDSAEAGINDLKKINLASNDVVVGISAAGDASYVVGSLEYAKSIGCKTVGVTSNDNTGVVRAADIAIVTDTGAEVITGSTRMKAGTAQKLVLNMLSTCVMIKSGNVYENLMINLKPTNVKLKQRMIGIVCDITGCDARTSEELLEKGEWSIRAAIELHK